MEAAEPRRVTSPCWIETPFAEPLPNWPSAPCGGRRHRIEERRDEQLPAIPRSRGR